MTVPAPSNRVSYVGNGATATFSFSFKISDASYLKVSTQAVDGTVTDLASGQYSATGIGSANGGTVTLTGGALASGAKITIRRVVPYTQPTSIPNQDGFLPQVVETALDRLTWQTQQLAEQVGRGVVAPSTETGPLTLPSNTARADTVLAFDGSGSPRVQSPSALATWLQSSLSSIFGPGLSQLSSSSALANWIITPIRGLLGQAYKGDPGGNVMAIGLFTAGGTLSISTGTDRVQTSGYATVGGGAAAYTYDATVDAAYVTAHPSTAFVSTNGRGFRLDLQQPLTIEMVGGKADRLLTTFDYLGSGYTGSWAVPGGVTDNWPPLLELMKLLAVTRAIHTVNGGGPMTPIGFANTDGRYCYHFGSTIIPPCTVYLRGNGAGGDVSAGVGTGFAFPPNTPGVIFNHENTQPAGYTVMGTNGSRIEGIRLMGGGGTDRTAHGLWHRMNISYDDVVIEKFAGNNYNNVGSVGADQSTPAFGLTSGTVGGSLTLLQAGNWNGWVDGSDVSASVFSYVKCKNSRLGGWKDTGYFGNTGFLSLQAFGDGNLGACWYGGRNYALISDVPGAGAATTPGTNDLIWHDWGAAGASSTRYPTWSASNTYLLSLPCYAAGLGTVYFGYIENYYLPVHLPPAAMWMGTPHNSRYTMQPLPQTDVAGFLNFAGGWAQRLAYSPDDTMLGSQMQAGIGGLRRSIWWHSRANEAGGGAYRLSYMADGVRYGLGFEEDGTPPVFQVSTNLNANWKWGRATAIPYVFSPNLLAIGDGTGNNGTGRLVRFGDAAPTSGEIAHGERILSQLPTPSGKADWIATTGGVAGSTAVIKTANPIDA